MAFPDYGNNRGIRQEIDYTWPMRTPYAPQRIFEESWRWLLDAVFPPGCISCQDPIDISGGLCARCWPDMTFLSDPMCDRCGYPFEYDRDEALLCGNCLRQPPVFSHARSVLKYDEFSRDMILGYKHTDQTRHAPAFASWMYRAAQDLVDSCDIICAVPLHPYRLLRRRYNQSALLTKELAVISGRPAIPDLLIRTAHTKSQGGLSAKARHRNVKGVFRVMNKHAERNRNARILLVDDVLTTGATAEACSQALLRGGAANVDVLTFCRVVRASNLSI